jgi:hypothetical protein
MFAVEVIDDEMIENLPNFKKRMKWVLDNKPELAALVSRWEVKGAGFQTFCHCFEDIV